MKYYNKYCPKCFGTGCTCSTNLNKKLCNGCDCGQEIPYDELDSDMYINLPPKKSWNINLKIKEYKRATPRIVLPEDYD